jgi:hypothetical protein
MQSAAWWQRHLLGIGTSYCWCSPWCRGHHEKHPRLQAGSGRSAGAWLDYGVLSIPTAGGEALLCVLRALSPPSSGCRSFHGLLLDAIVPLHCDGVDSSLQCFEQSERLLTPFLPFPGISMRELPATGRLRGGQ